MDFPMPRWLEPQPERERFKLDELPNLRGWPKPKKSAKRKNLRKKSK